ncbi:MAG TPA: glycosyltransferase family 2 protein [Candidatus Polarisedimenticolaceae bacterium]
MIARVAAAIPAYQAAATVAAVVTGTRPLVAELIVVDDGSTDGTGNAARAAGAEVLVHASNLGKGRALRTAFDALFARGADAVVTLDADGQHRPDQIPRLIDGASGGADLVLGTRDHVFSAMSPVRRASNRVSSFVISAVAGVQLRDIQTGFRLYTRRLVDACGFPEPRFEAESAVIIRAARRGLRIEIVPVRMDLVDGRATSHYRPLVDSLRIAFAVAKARLEPAAEHPRERP